MDDSSDPLLSVLKVIYSLALIAWLLALWLWPRWLAKEGRGTAEGLAFGLHAFAAAAGACVFFLHGARGSLSWLPERIDELFYFFAVIFGIGFVAGTAEWAKHRYANNDH